MRKSYRELFLENLGSQGGKLGEVVFWQNQSGVFQVCHELDAELAKPKELEVFRTARAARELAVFTRTGEYRFLKAGRDLRAGWLLLLETAEELREALNYLYPAALALWRAALEGQLELTPLRETLERQSGMYRYAKTINRRQVAEIMGSLCRKQCGKQTLWATGSKFPSPKDGRIPLLCREACNAFVAEAARKSRS